MLGGPLRTVTRPDVRAALDGAAADRRRGAAAQTEGGAHPCGDPDRSILAAQVEITAAQGGHAAAVQALLPVNPSGQQPLLLSADWEGALKVWDMRTGGCVQTLPGAHAHVVMGLLQWEARPAFARDARMRAPAARGRTLLAFKRSGTG
jgi:hypothetical protein